MKKIMSLLITAVCMVGNLSIAATIPTAPSVTFGSVSDANTLNSTQFNKYDGSVFVKTSDGTANGAVESVWHYSIKNNKWVKVPVAESVVTGGTNLQYWRGDKTWQTLNTLVVPESTNLYFTDTRARSSLSAGTGISYNNSTGVISSIVPIMQRFSLASAFSSTSVTQAAVTGWSFPVTTGKSYRIEIIATYQTAATTTGGAMGFVLIGGGAGTIAGELEAKITSTSTASDMKQSIYTINATTGTTGSTLTTKGVGTINQPHHIGGHLIFNCTTSGTFQVNYATEVAASASQLNAGSVLFVTEF